MKFYYFLVNLPYQIAVLFFFLKNKIMKMINSLVGKRGIDKWIDMIKQKQ